MRIIVTAGGTQEPIDSVRSITNHASGRLGALIAEAFAARPEVAEVVCVCPRRAVQPRGEKIRIHPAESTADLEAALAALCREKNPAAIIHSMAVSDYRVKAVTTMKEMVSLIHPQPGGIPRYAQLSGLSGLDTSGKLSSTVEDLVLLLEKTPKVIAGLRDLAPDATIVGFKLLDGVPHEELMAVAARLLEENRCDFVLANDNVTVHSDCHEGFLLDRQGAEQHFAGKEQIAQGIAERVLEAAAERR